MVEEEVRKVVTTGRSSVAITIPKRWLTALGIGPGSHVLLRFMGNYIALAPMGGAAKAWGGNNSIGVDRDDPEYVLRKVITQYLRGASEVRVRFGDHVSIKGSVKGLVRDRISGAEVIEEGADYLVIRFVMPTPEIPIKRLLNRMMLVVLGMARDAIDILRGSGGDPEDVIERDNEVDRLYLLVERLVMSGLIDQAVLSKLEVVDSRELVNSLMVAKFIERAGDHAWRIAQVVRETQTLCCKLVESPIVNDIADLGSMAIDLFRGSVLSFINADVEGAVKTLDMRLKMRGRSMDVIGKIYSSGLPVEIGGRLMMIVESIRRMSEYAYDVAEITLDTYG
ncbi:MAG: AbrB/MazE/SpoVT family DNA-binding domain-containing protein [Vulcanisaeta sp.]|nr:AbrB/MazE/SpoVT family DNA-binding domain-containing protein [Vulcanisaeta sp.]